MNREQRRAQARQIRRESGLHRIRVAVSGRNEKPLDAGQLANLGIAYHGALHAITHGQANGDDLETLAVAANVALMLCERGFGLDEVATVKDGQDAILRMMRRHHEGKPIATTGPELVALQRLLELHDAQVEHPLCTHGVLAGVLIECKRRVLDGQVLEVA